MPDKRSGFRNRESLSKAKRRAEPSNRNSSVGVSQDWEYRLHCCSSCALTLPLSRRGFQLSAAAAGWTASAMCCSELRPPAPDAPTIDLVVVTECSPQRRLFVKDNENVRDEAE